MDDAVRKRFGETAGLVAEQQDRRAAATAERLRRLLTLTGEERALDVGTGAGALAIALAPLVREVVGVDIVPELLEEGRKRAPAKVELVEADATALPFEDGSFDLVCTSRTLHHVPRPTLVLAEMTRRAAARRDDARRRPARARRPARGDRPEPLRARPRPVDDPRARRRRLREPVRREQPRPPPGGGRPRGARPRGLPRSRRLSRRGARAGASPRAARPERRGRLVRPRQAASSEWRRLAAIRLAA